MRFRRYAFLLFVCGLLVACTANGERIEPESGSDSSFSEPVPLSDIVSLVCGPQADCFSEICVDSEKCPLRIALSNQTIFDFVKTYAACEGCNTPAFSPDKGVGKCIEYATTDALQGWKIKFWVSDTCNFRHSNPTQTSITVTVDTETSTIETISPAEEYIKDPLYCKDNSDCKCLSGSGVPFIGCSNFLYAPLNWSGYFSGDDCVCHANQCKQKSE